MILMEMLLFNKALCSIEICFVNSLHINNIAKTNMYVCVCYQSKQRVWLDAPIVKIRCGLCIMRSHTHTRANNPQTDIHTQTHILYNTCVCVSWQHNNRLSVCQPTNSITFVVILFATTRKHLKR